MRLTIAFDLDGTLAETAGDLIGTLNSLLVDEGLAPLPVERARDLVGAGARALIQRGFDASSHPLTKAHLDTLFATFLDRYAERIADESTLFPGVTDALDLLKDAGHILAVCTNKPEYHSRLLLDALDVTDRFAAICGRDTFPFCKPDPRHLTATIETAGGDPSKAILVGDSRTDHDTARAAGTPFIAVPFGYTDIPVAQLNPDVLIDHFKHLPTAIDALIGNGIFKNQPKTT
jgi:phosphoglycolate phosphatase